MVMGGEPSHVAHPPDASSARARVYDKLTCYRQAKLVAAVHQGEMTKVKVHIAVTALRGKKSEATWRCEQVAQPIDQLLTSSFISDLRSVVESVNGRYGVYKIKVRDGQVCSAGFVHRYKHKAHLNNLPSKEYLNVVLKASRKRQAK